MKFGTFFMDKVSMLSLNMINGAVIDLLTARRGSIRTAVSAG